MEPGLYNPVQRSRLFHLLRKLNTFRNLDREGQNLVVEALLLPVLIALGFRIFGVSRTQGYLRRWAHAGRCQQKVDAGRAIASARRAQRMVQLNSGVSGTCLSRSLALWAMLLRRNVHTTLAVGFRKNANKMEGHAWLECDGIPLNEDARVVATYSVSDKPLSLDSWRAMRP